jgi:hypothetical protein
MTIWPLSLNSSPDVYGTQTVVGTMARACMHMKDKYGISLEGEDCALSRYSLFKGIWLKVVSFKESLLN